MIWRYLDSGERTGQYNMDLDKRLAVEVGASERPPVLRFFQWKPYCISLGKHQKISDIDMDKARLDGIDVVYRPTGGRAILHAEELTYSVVFKNELSGSVEETYRLISEALAEGIRAFGIPAMMNPVQPDFKSWYQQPSSKLCFSSSARHEIQVDGRKLVGSAQRRIAGAVLQHGSILIGPFHRRLPDYLNAPEPAKQLMREIMEEKTTEISQFKSVSADDLKTSIRDAFSRIFNIEFQPIGAESKQALLKAD
jgi:lipoate-protein ligase A